MDRGDWLKKYISILVALGEKFGAEGADLSFSPHTVAKDLSVYYYAETFAKVARGPKAKGRGYDGAVYLDLFAGGGVISTSHELAGKAYTDLIGGSPIAATSTKFPFTYSVHVELNGARADLLNRRLATYLQRGSFDVKTGNSNDLIDEIIKEVKDKFKSPIVLAFIDPQGMEARWETARKLSAAFPNLDFMINVTSGAARVAGRIDGGMVADIPIFQDYFGPKAEEILVRLNNGENVGDVYSKEVREVLGKTEGATLNICGPKGKVAYHLLGYTRSSWTGSPWANGFTELKKYLDGICDDDIAGILDVIKGRQSPLF